MAEKKEKECFFFLMGKKDWKVFDASCLFFGEFLISMLEVSEKRRRKEQSGLFFLGIFDVG